MNTTLHLASISLRAVVRIPDHALKGGRQEPDVLRRHIEAKVGYGPLAHPTVNVRVP